MNPLPAGKNLVLRTTLLESENGVHFLGEMNGFVPHIPFPLAQLGNVKGHAESRLTPPQRFLRHFMLGDVQNNAENSVDGLPLEQRHGGDLIELVPFRTLELDAVYRYCFPLQRPQENLLSPWNVLFGHYGMVMPANDLGAVNFLEPEVGLDEFPLPV
ncbi:hypothetical protein D3C75_911200 [compost metagenome]